MIDVIESIYSVLNLIPGFKSVEEFLSKVIPDKGNTNLEEGLDSAKELVESLGDFQSVIRGDESAETFVKGMISGEHILPSFLADKLGLRSDSLSITSLANLKDQLSALSKGFETLNSLSQAVESV